MNTGLSKYYKLFGLSETATQADIKKRYRQLAMLYHPDKHGGNDRKFVEIKEAYEYLTGKRTISHPQHTHTYSPTRSSSQARQQSQEERIKQAKQRQRDTIYKEHIENERYFQSLISGNRWRTIRISAIAGALITFILLVELFLPYRYEKDQIIAYDNYEIGAMESGSSVKKFYLESGRNFYIKDLHPIIYQSDPEILLVKSSIFHNDTGVLSFYNTQELFHPIQYNLGAHSLLLIPFFLFPLFIRLFKRKTHTFTLFYFLSLYLSTPLIAYYLFSNYRWLHLLTLGSI